MREIPQDEPVVQGFDTRVTFRDQKTGQITKQDPYIQRVCGEGTNRSVFFERPAGSGNLWSVAGKPVGRWDATKPEGERFISNAEHVAWERPQTEDEKLASRLIAKDQENAILKAEVAALKAEKAKRAKGSGKE